MGGLVTRGCGRGEWRRAAARSSFRSTRTSRREAPRRCTFIRCRRSTTSGAGTAAGGGRRALQLWLTMAPRRSICTAARSAARASACTRRPSLAACCRSTSPVRASSMRSSPCSCSRRPSTAARRADRDTVSHTSTAPNLGAENPAPPPPPPPAAPRPRRQSDTGSRATWRTHRTWIPPRRQLIPPRHRPTPPRHPPTPPRSARQGAAPPSRSHQPASSPKRPAAPRSLLMRPTSGGGFSCCRLARPHSEHARAFRASSPRQPAGRIPGPRR